MANRRPHTVKPHRQSWPAVAGVFALALLIGVGWWFMQPKQESAPAAMAMSDSIPGAPPMPDWLKTANPMTKTEYVWAASHLDELKYIPCYCGCSKDGHIDNFSCYYQRDFRTGTISGYDQMSLG